MNSKAFDGGEAHPDPEERRDRGGTPMKIGCPKEIKPQEFRVGLTPAAVREAVAHGHDVLIETVPDTVRGSKIPTTSQRGAADSCHGGSRSLPKPT
jgi:hypothetical protein